MSNKLDPKRKGPGYQLSVRITDDLLEALRAEQARLQDARLGEKVDMGDVVRGVLGKALLKKAAGAVGKAVRRTGRRSGSR